MDTVFHKFIPVKCYLVFFTLAVNSLLIDGV